jgi:CobQ-like glutamine amidotransferase family enzyme
VSTNGHGERAEIVLIFQSLLGIYGDRGNATVLIKRLGWRGYDPVLTVVEPGDRVPDTGRVYLLGGGEDAAQISAVRALRADGGLQRASTEAQRCSRSAPAIRSSATRSPSVSATR